MKKGKRNFIIKKLVFIVIFFGCHIQVTAQSSFNKLVWSDEFNYTGLPDTAKWGYDKGNGCPDICGWGNNELQYYNSNNLRNARVEKGRLVIEVKKEDKEGSKYTSARMVTKNKGDWKYGRFEIRAKIPSGKGIWPAIWMLPTAWEYGGWPHSGEIDIMENVGYWPDSLFGTIHTGAYNGANGLQKSKGIYTDRWSKNFHTYAMEWTADSISFFVDKKKYHVFKNEHRSTEAWPFDKEFHLLLNVAVGGNWGGKYGVDDRIFPQKMEVDYVRVYQ